APREPDAARHDPRDESLPLAAAPHRGGQRHGDRRLPRRHRAARGRARAPAPAAAQAAGVAARRRDSAPQQERMTPARPMLAGVVAALALCTVVPRATAAESARLVTLDEAEARALATHERIRAAQAVEERTEVAPWRAASALAPNVRDRVSYT